MSEPIIVNEPLTGLRGALFTAASATALWRVLPARVQGWLCNCAVCRGEETG